MIDQAFFRIANACLAVKTKLGKDMTQDGSRGKIGICKIESHIVSS